MRQAGEQVGIQFTGLCDRYPNTVDAHRLLSLALKTYGPDVQNRVQEILFRSYYTDGVYPGENNLIKIGVEAGMKAAEIEELLRSDALRREVLEEDRSVKDKHDVHGVPYFFINGQDVGLSGAQAPEAFVQAFRAATM